MVAVSDSDSQLRLIDAAFGNVCSAICDLSMQVRTQAAELLGGMAKVSCEFLHQTLDKKLMSNMRVSLFSLKVKTEKITKLNFRERKVFTRETWIILQVVNGQVVKNGLMTHQKNK